MSYKIIPTPVFQRDVKYLKKKYRHIASDLEKLNSILIDDPAYGDAVTGLEGRVFKARLASSDMGKGKSGGFRIIYYLRSSDNTIYLLTIYAKAYKEDIDPVEIKALLKKIGLGDFT
ncbi:MAG: type II toxin-antitoxin system RelE/ParE family toxin [Nitrospirota bacterium]